MASSSSAGSKGRRPLHKNREGTILTAQESEEKECETYQDLRKLQQIIHRPSRLFEVKTFTDNIVLIIPERPPRLKGGPIAIQVITAVPEPVASFAGP